MASKRSRKKHEPPDGEHGPWWAWIIRGTTEGFFSALASVAAVALLKRWG